MKTVRIGEIEPIPVAGEELQWRPDEAVDHLRAAVEAQPKYVEYARTDPDLDSIGDDPRFPK